jgi:cholesterol oxidase
VTATGEEFFDAVVIGSGFGGSVAALGLAEAKKRTLLLERGRPWPPGSFPRSPQAVTHDLYWDPSRGKFGIFDIWSFRKLDALVSSGLGGGSLIYANVLLRKEPEWFVQTPEEWWPFTRDDLEPHYDAVEPMFDVQTYPFGQEPYASVPKVQAFVTAAAANHWKAEPAPLAVTFRAPGAPVAVPGQDFDDGSRNRHGRLRQTCILCGCCDIGCNVGAKNTLDYTILSTPAVRDGVEVRTMCEVRTLAPDRARGRGYVVGYVEHDLEADRRPHDTAALPLRTVSTDRLVIGAGSVGSTWLLLRNRAQFPHLGPALGSRFCGNGDLLGFVTHARQPGTGGVSEPLFLDPSYGPVITSYVRRPGPRGRDFVVEDASYPEFLNWAWQVQPGPALVGRTAKFVAGLVKGRITGRRPSDMTGAVGILLGEQNSGGLMPFLGMGRDVPDGRLRLRNGRLDLDWTMATSREYFDAVRATMRGLAAGLGGRYRDNPYWWIKRIITNHPVGGCPTGPSPATSVLDPWLQAWNYPGLFVVDGAAMPGPVGTNPSLTIAAMAHRAAERIVGPVTESVPP